MLQSKCRIHAKVITRTLWSPESLILRAKDRGKRNYFFKTQKSNIMNTRIFKLLPWKIFSVALVKGSISYRYDLWFIIFNLNKVKIIFMEKVHHHMSMNQINIESIYSKCLFIFDKKLVHFCEIFPCILYSSKNFSFRDDSICTMILQ